MADGEPTETGNQASPTTSPYTVTFQPQEDTSEYYHKTPVLPKTHAVIIHTSLDETFEGGTERTTCVGQMLGEALERPESIGEGEQFKVVYHDVTKEITPEKMTKDIRTCLKVVVIFSKNLNTNERLMEEWKVITDMTSERNIECVIPVLYDVTPEEIPLNYKESSVMPAGFMTDYIKVNGEFYRPLVKQLSETVIIGTGDFTGMGVCLAWGHFFGWYSLVLQGLRQRVEETAEASAPTWELPKPFYLHPKMIAIIPKRGYHPKRTSLNDYDPEVRILMKPKAAGDGTKEVVKAKYTIPTQGYPDKDYSNPLHYTTHKGKTYVFVAEVPTTLKSLTGLQHRGYSDKFEEDEHHRELHRFKAQLEKILAKAPESDGHSEARRQALSVICYDEDKAKEKSLSQLIAETIEIDVTFRDAPWKI